MGALGHPGASQLYFPLSAGMIVGGRVRVGARHGARAHVGCLRSGVCGGGRRARRRDRRGARAGVHALGRSPRPPDPRARPCLHPAARGGHAPCALRRGSPRSPCGCCRFCCWPVPPLRARVRRFRYLRGALVGVLGWALVTASVVTGVIAYVDLARAPGPSRAAPDDQLAWTRLAARPPPLAAGPLRDRRRGGHQPAVQCPRAAGRRVPHGRSGGSSTRR